MKELVPMLTLVRAAKRRKDGYLEACLVRSERVMIGGVEHRRFKPENWIWIHANFRVEARCQDCIPGVKIFPA